MRVGVLLIALAGCGGPPPPILGELSPNVVCGSGTLPLSLSGENFLARPSRTLHGAAGLDVPAVSLEPESGSAVFPDVTWISTELLSLSVPLEQLSAGSYALTLTDPDGQAAHSDGALTLVDVPPVSIQSVAPAAICLADGDQPLTVTGMGFDPAATLSIRDSGGAPVLAPGGTIGPTSITLALPKGSLGPGRYTLVVENPATAGCQATAAQQLTIDPAPELTKVDPNQLCGAGARLQVTGSGLEAGATVALVGGSVSVTATQVRVDSPTSAVVTVGANSFTKNMQVDLVWSNPDGCAVTLAKAVRVKPGKGGCN